MQGQQYQGVSYTQFARYKIDGTERSFTNAREFSGVSNLYCKIGYENEKMALSVYVSN